MPGIWKVLLLELAIISFTRYFYKPQPMRTLDEIRADILALEQKSEGLLGELLGR